MALNPTGVPPFYLLNTGQIGNFREEVLRRYHFLQGVKPSTDNTRSYVDEKFTPHQRLA
jgi:hypothetical protein